MKRSYYIPLALFGVLVIFLGIGLNLDPRHVPSPLIGKPAPTFELPRLLETGKTFTPEEMKGKVWLFNIWATWCVSCKAEHPTLVELGKTGAVDIVGLNYKDESEAAVRWLQVLGNPYVANAVDADGRIGIDWGFYGAPETFVIDKKGIIRHKHVGPISPKDLAETIMPLVAQLQEEEPA